jgi:hypothetical protein
MDNPRMGTGGDIKKGKTHIQMDGWMDGVSMRLPTFQTNKLLPSWLWTRLYRFKPRTLQ